MYYKCVNECVVLIMIIFFQPPESTPNRVDVPNQLSLDHSPAYHGILHADIYNTDLSAYQLKKNSDLTEW